MKFKEWLINESGHFMMAHPVNITVLYHGKPVLFKGVSMIDPNLEDIDIPMPKFKPEDPKSKYTHSKKFLGQFTFSLPLVDSEGKRISQWLVVPRIDGMMFGSTSKAYVSSKPEGIQVPLNWGDAADIMDDSGRISATYGGNVAI